MSVSMSACMHIDNNSYLKMGPALSSSHCRHSFRAHAGAGPLFGSVRWAMQDVKHAVPS